MNNMNRQVLLILKILQIIFLYFTWRINFEGDNYSIKVLQVNFLLFYINVEEENLMLTYTIDLNIFNFRLSFETYYFYSKTIFNRNFFITTHTI